MTYTFNFKLSHRDKIAAGRGLARKRLPYFQAALYGLQPRPFPGMWERVNAGMAMTPRGILYYDPRVVEDEWDLEDVEFGLLHEVSHFLRDHAKRCEEYGYDPQTWNLAGDAAINDDLVACGCKPLDSDMLPAKIFNPTTNSPCPDGWTEEAYYEALRKQPKKPQGQSGGKATRPGNGNCGGGAGNPLDLPDDGVSSKTAAGKSQVEIERIKKAVAGDIQKHMEEHGRGSIPGGWAVWAGQQLSPPVVRWQDKLRRAFRRGVDRIKGSMDYHYGRPSRRQWALGGFKPGVPVLPSMYAHTVRIGVFVDTSGSMGQEDLRIAMSEVKGLMQGSDAEVIFGVCDAQVHGRIEKVRDIGQACARLSGGGGTDFVPVFEELMRMRPSHRPNLIVFLTDGDGPAPTRCPPGLSVIWVLVGRDAVVPYDQSHSRIKWGEQIFVPASSK